MEAWLKETIWHRGWNDARQGWLGWRFLLLEAVGAPMSGLVAELFGMTNFGVALVVILVVVIGLLAIWINATVSAPIKQRNEARQKIKELQVELSKQQVLAVHGPYSRVAVVDTNDLPLWYVIVENTQPETVATNVRVRIDNPSPQIATSFPIELHRMNDNDKPFTKAHDVRYGEPLTFDLFACGQVEPDMYYLYRADGDEAQQLGPEWMLSEADNKVISSALRGTQGWGFDVIAVPDPPALPVRKHLRVRINAEENWPYVESYES